MTWQMKTTLSRVVFILPIRTGLTLAQKEPSARFYKRCNHINDVQELDLLNMVCPCAR